MKNETNNFYDIAYKTKSGRMMIAKRVEGKTSNDAKAKLKKQMRSSTSFDKIVTAIKL